MTNLLDRVTVATLAAEEGGDAAAWATLAGLEIAIAALAPADDVHGASARFGAVRALVRAGQSRRARALASRYLRDPALSGARRVQIEAVLA